MKDWYLCSRLKSLTHVSPHGDNCEDESVIHSASCVLKLAPFLSWVRILVTQHSEIFNTMSSRKTVCTDPIKIFTKDASSSTVIRLLFINIATIPHHYFKNRFAVFVDIFLLSLNLCTQLHTFFTSIRPAGHIADIFHWISMGLSHVRCW
jgi:hypothetical protein